MKLKSAPIEAFDQYSQFTTLKEFNSHIEMWLLAYKKDFTKAELVGLKRLIRFSAKIPGVCTAKIGTILKAIYEEYSGNGISRSTFKRMIGKASKLGILTIHETTRKNGSRTHNLYVFSRFPKPEPPAEKILNHPKTNNLSKTKTQEKNKRIEQAIDHSFTSDIVPKSFVQLVKCFFNDACTIEEYWRMACIAAYRNNREKEKDLVLEMATHAFKQMIGKLKQDKIRRNPVAYFFGILEKKCQELYFEELDAFTNVEGRTSSSISSDINSVAREVLLSEQQSIFTLSEEVWE